MQDVLDTEISRGIQTAVQMSYTAHFIISCTSLEWVLQTHSWALFRWLKEQGMINLYCLWNCFPEAPVACLWNNSFAPWSSMGMGVTVHQLVFQPRGQMLSKFL